MSNQINLRLMWKEALIADCESYYWICMELFSQLQKGSLLECVGIDQKVEVLKGDNEAGPIHTL